MDFKGLINKAKDSLTTLELDIDENTLVGELQELFKEKFKLTFRVYYMDSLADPNNKIGDVSNYDDETSKKPVKIKGTFTIKQFSDALFNSYGAITAVADYHDTHIVPESITLGQASRNEYTLESFINDTQKNQIVDLIQNKKGFKYLSVLFSYLEDKEISRQDIMPKYKFIWGTNANEYLEKTFNAVSSKELTEIIPDLFEQCDNTKFKVKPKYITELVEIAYKIKKIQYDETHSIGNYSISELKEKLLKDFNTDGNLTPRLLVFYGLLSESNKPITRMEYQQCLFENELAESLSKAGTYLSNISVYLNKPTNDYVRQIITYTEKMKIKDDFFIENIEFRIMIKELLSAI